MDETSKELIRLAENMSKEDQDLMIDSNFAYIFTKAKHLLSLGVDEYVRDNYFKISLDELNNSDKEELENVCFQIISGKGFRFSCPLETSVHVFYKIFELFHFTARKIKTHRLDKGFLDEMCLTHMVTKEQVAYYNFIEIKLPNIKVK